MLLLNASTDKLQVITSGAAISVKVHASYVDLASDLSTVSQTPQLTSISSATTTDVVAAPPANTTRNIQTLIVNNSSGSGSVTVFVQVNSSATLYPLARAVLGPYECLTFLNSVGFVKLSAGGTTRLFSSSTGDQTANAADTYITGSALQLPSMSVGTTFRWLLAMSKTGAGTATPILKVRIGVNGIITDTAQLTFTGVAQTANADNGIVEISATVRGPISASGYIQGLYNLYHNLQTTGLSNQAQSNIISTLSSAFDLTTANLYVGLSCNPGASGVWTFTQVISEAILL